MFDCTMTQTGPSVGCSQTLDLAQPEEKLYFSLQAGGEFLKTLNTSHTSTAVSSLADEF